MLTDPVTSPTSASGRVVFAMGAAIITTLIRLKCQSSRRMFIFHLIDEYVYSMDRVMFRW